MAATLSGIAVQVFANLWVQQPELAVGLYAAGAVAVAVPHYVPTFEQVKFWCQMSKRSNRPVAEPIPVAEAALDTVNSIISHNHRPSFTTATRSASALLDFKTPATIEQHIESEAFNAPSVPAHAISNFPAAGYSYPIESSLVQFQPKSGAEIETSVEVENEISETFLVETPSILSEHVTSTLSNEIPVLSQSALKDSTAGTSRRTLEPAGIYVPDAQEGLLNPETQSASSVVDATLPGSDTEAFDPMRVVCDTTSSSLHDEPNLSESTPNVSLASTESKEPTASGTNIGVMSTVSAKVGDLPFRTIFQVIADNLPATPKLYKKLEIGSDGSNNLASSSSIVLSNLPSGQFLAEATEDLFAAEGHRTAVTTSVEQITTKPLHTSPSLAALKHMAYADTPEIFGQRPMVYHAEQKRIGPSYHANIISCSDVALVIVPSTLIAIGVALGSDDPMDQDLYATLMASFCMAVVACLSCLDSRRPMLRHSLFAIYRHCIELISYFMLSLTEIVHQGQKTLATVLGKQPTDHVIADRAPYAGLIGTALVPLFIIISGKINQLQQRAELSQRGATFFRLSLGFGVGLAVVWSSVYVQDFVLVFTTACLVFLIYSYHGRVLDLTSRAIYGTCRSFKAAAWPYVTVYTIVAALIYLASHPQQLLKCFNGTKDGISLPFTHRAIVVKYGILLIAVRFMHMAFALIVRRLRVVQAWVRDKYRVLIRYRHVARLQPDPKRFRELLTAIVLVAEKVPSILLEWIIPTLKAIAMLIVALALMRVLIPFYEILFKRTWNTIQPWTVRTSTTAPHVVKESKPRTAVNTTFFQTWITELLTRVAFGSLASASTIISLALTKSSTTLGFLHSVYIEPVAASIGVSCLNNWCHGLAWWWLPRATAIILATVFCTTGWAIAAKAYPEQKIRSCLSFATSSMVVYTLGSLKVLRCTQDYPIVLATVLGILFYQHSRRQPPPEARALASEVAADGVAADEAPVDEAPVDEVPVDRLVADEVPAEIILADELFADELFDNQAPEDEAHEDEAPIIEAPPNLPAELATALPKPVGLLLPSPWWQPLINWLHANNAAREAEETAIREAIAAAEQEDAEFQAKVDCMRGNRPSLSAYAEYLQSLRDMIAETPVVEPANKDGETPTAERAWDTTRPFRSMNTELQHQTALGRELHVETIPHAISETVTEPVSGLIAPKPAATTDASILALTSASAPLFGPTSLFTPATPAPLMTPIDLVRSHPLATANSMNPSASFSSIFAPASTTTPATAQQPASSAIRPSAEVDHSKELPSIIITSPKHETQKDSHEASGPTETVVTAAVVDGIPAYKSTPPLVIEPAKLGTSAIILGIEQVSQLPSSSYASGSSGKVDKSSPGHNDGESDDGDDLSLDSDEFGTDDDTFERELIEEPERIDGKALAAVQQLRQEMARGGERKKATTAVQVTLGETPPPVDNGDVSEQEEEAAEQKDETTPMEVDSDETPTSVDIAIGSAPENGVDIPAQETSSAKSSDNVTTRGMNNEDEAPTPVTTAAASSDTQQPTNDVSNPQSSLPTGSGPSFVSNLSAHTAPAMSMTLPRAPFSALPLLSGSTGITQDELDTLYALPAIYQRPLARPMSPALPDSVEQWRNRLLGGESTLTKMRREREEAARKARDEGNGGDPPVGPGGPSGGDGGSGGGGYFLVPYDLARTGSSSYPHALPPSADPPEPMDEKEGGPLNGEGVHGETDPNSHSNNDGQTTNTKADLHDQKDDNSSDDSNIDFDTPAQGQTSAIGGTASTAPLVDAGGATANTAAPNNDLDIEMPDLPDTNEDDNDNADLNTPVATGFNTGKLLRMIQAAQHAGSQPNGVLMTPSALEGAQEPFNGEHDDWGGACANAADDLSLPVVPTPSTLQEPPIDRSATYSLLSHASSSDAYRNDPPTQQIDRTSLEELARNMAAKKDQQMQRDARKDLSLPLDRYMDLSDTENQDEYESQGVADGHEDLAAGIDHDFEASSDNTTGADQPTTTADDEDDDVDWTDIRPRTCLVQLWEDDQIVDNPDYPARRSAGMKSLEATYGQPCQVFREVDMVAYETFGENHESFHYVQDGIDWFNPEAEGAEPREDPEDEITEESHDEVSELQAGANENLSERINTLKTGFDSALLVDSDDESDLSDPPNNEDLDKIGDDLLMEKMSGNIPALQPKEKKRYTGPVSLDPQEGDIHPTKKPAPPINRYLLEMMAGFNSDPVKRAALQNLANKASSAPLNPFKAESYFSITSLWTTGNIKPIPQHPSFVTSL
ncbi:hypothetical protein G6011_00159 [Alternaria panax]|uniref:Uncharacterized protein n=1 Tax=Alternaria panax TaxID=48097 RepID=A0AAD4NUS7_9PLEO|nr:hypothetical protein G6011_00159 [Alternaria panax]